MQDLPSCRLFILVNMPCFTTPKQLDVTGHTQHRMWASRKGTLSPCLCGILTRLNHFSYCLRPVALRTPCLTFGITSACPVLATRWLTYLAGAGFSPAGIIVLARTHTPFTLRAVSIWHGVKLLDPIFFRIFTIKRLQTEICNHFKPACVDNVNHISGLSTYLPGWRCDCIHLQCNRCLSQQSAIDGCTSVHSDQGFAQNYAFKM